jgi:hypothetical protein
MPALFSFAAPDRLGLRAPPHELSLYELSLSVDISRHGRRASPSRILLSAISVYPVEGAVDLGVRLRLSILCSVRDFPAMAPLRFDPSFAIGVSP